MQLNLFPEVETLTKFPSTRYQGSKAKFVEWIWYCVKDIPCHTVLDAFGGTGCVGYKFKQEGKQVFYNDILRFNSIIAKALIENNNQYLDDIEVDNILRKHSEISYPNFIESTFQDIYFTEEENQWLDIVLTNIRNMSDLYKQTIAYFALFQSCIIKRPYNLFHRKNLYVRMQDVQRSFGNKATWDTPFEVHFRKFVEEANNAIFDNGLSNTVFNVNVLDLPNHFDLVYMDSPYISDQGVGLDYADFYHFLEGMCDYEHWGEKIDYNSKHKRLKRKDSEWVNKNLITNAFEKVINKFKDSTLVISYRKDGIPSINAISDLLSKYGKDVQVFESKNIKYVLSNKSSNEVLIVGR